MSDNKDALHELIHALTPMEKWRFKRYAGRYDKGATKKYVKLFDAIAKQSEYNEEKLIKRFRNEKFINQPAVAKNYLYNIIMKSLVEYDEKNVVEIEVNHLLLSVNKLFEKNLFKQAYKQLHKAQRLIKKHNLPTKSLEANLKEQNLATYTLPVHQQAKTFDKLHEKLIEEMSAFQTEREFILLWRKCMGTNYLYGWPRNNRELKKYLEIYQHPRLQHEPGGNMSYSRFCYLGIMASYHELNGDYTKALSVYKDLLDFMENKISSKSTTSGQKETHTLNNINNLFSYLITSLKTEHFFIPDVQQKWGELENFSLDKNYSDKIREKAFFYFSMAELERLIVHSNYEEGQSTVIPIQNVLEDTYSKNTRSPFEYGLLVSLSRFCFYAGMYQQALYWINKANNHQAANKVEGNYGWLKILTIIIHLELGNDRVIEYSIKSTYRYLAQRKRLFRSEKIILEFFRNEVPKVYSDKDLNNALQKLYTSLKKIRNDRFEKHILDQFDILSWLKNRIKGS
ncbi:MAG: hypothetical protein EA412_00205 [Chitinophagaceae bacterium]|nr:MAG: hypothetical protein EA412_00205 [Chitinophagaceae bacterium]